MRPAATGVVPGSLYLGRTAPLAKGERPGRIPVEEEAETEPADVRAKAAPLP
jgi:hypothetical protein